MRSMALMAGCLLTAAAFAAEPESTATDNWRLVRDRDGVQVSTRPQPGSKIVAFEAVTIVPVTVQAVLDQIIDYANYPEWYAHCREVEMLDFDHAGGPILRTVVRTPFPLPNRDIVNQVRFVESGADRVYIELANMPDFAEPVKGLVRLQQASGYWELEKTGEGTRVVHGYHVDPKVPAPRWLVNRFIIDGPLRTLLRLRDRLTQ